MIRRRGRSSRLFALLVTSALLAGGCGGSEGAEQNRGHIRAMKVASLREPIFLAQPPGETHDLYAVERAGTIRVIGPDGVDKQPFLDIRQRVRTEGESGMLSMAFPPDYADSGLFYIAYSGR